MAGELDAHAGDGGFEDQGAVDDALAFSHGSAAGVFDHFGDHVQLGGRSHDSAEGHVVAAGEPHEAHVGSAARWSRSAELGGAFDHQDAGHDGASGDVAAAPRIRFR